MQDRVVRFGTARVVEARGSALAEGQDAGGFVALARHVQWYCPHPSGVLVALEAGPVLLVAGTIDAVAAAVGHDFGLVPQGAQNAPTPGQDGAQQAPGAGTPAGATPEAATPPAGAGRPPAGKAGGRVRGPRLVPNR